MPSAFVDTTTLLYPLDPTTPVKQRACAGWLKALRDADQLVISPQVLNESYWVVVRKPAFAAARPFIRAYLSEYALWATAPLDFDRLSQAWTLEDHYGVSFWDALLLASANSAGCSHFLSEDLSDGQDYGGVTVINPFRHAPSAVLGPALP